MMTQLKPVNNHLLIEPIKNESFMSSMVDTYQEIGVVVAFDPKLNGRFGGFGDDFKPTSAPDEVKIGYKVYFDSWLASKFPKEGTTDEFYWLVKWEDIRMVEEYVKPIPEK